MPDAQRLSGLRSSCNLLNFQFFVGRITRSPASGINKCTLSAN
ncbi:hypothetical protein V411_16160 [Escherichia coli LAU-EC6]|nr:hypothetical protein W817_19045 [Escherichia coli RS218]AKK34987.1 hypothetical protein APECO18_13090 [Escherichia coli APEC O18]ETE14571.1 hypothetical protein V411_16160 [Escherichia coli LAU-EC6]